MDNDIKPKVTVFIALFNSEKYIKKTIESVLAQTYQNFEILIINDGSTDKSVKVVEFIKDSRIRLIHNDINRGLVYTRNRGFEETHTEYIAILDSDDIWYPTKLEKQIKFLEAHSDFALLGTWTELIGSNGKKTGVAWKKNIAPEKIPIVLLFHNCFTQSSVLLKMNMLGKMRYRSPDTDEDYDLWIQISKKWRTWNIPEILTQYRVHGENITKKPIVKSFLDNEIRKELETMGVNPTPEEFVVHRTNYIYRNSDVKNFILQREQWLQKLKDVNASSGHFLEKTFSEAMSERWLTSCSANAYVGLWMWNIFWKSDLSKNIWKENFLDIAKFFIKCIVKM